VTTKCKCGLAAEFVGFDEKTMKLIFKCSCGNTFMLYLGC
jgi:hypothetical protein